MPANRSALLAVEPKAEPSTDAAEMPRPADRLVFYEDLKPKYGIPYNRVHIYRLMRKGTTFFPISVRVTEGGRAAWLESEIVDWIRNRPRAITIRPDAKTTQTGER